MTATAGEVVCLWSTPWTQSCVACMTAVLLREHCYLLILLDKKSTVTKLTAQLGAFKPMSVIMLLKPPSRQEMALF